MPRKRVEGAVSDASASAESASGGGMTSSRGSVLSVIVEGFKREHSGEWDLISRAPLEYGLKHMIEVLDR